MFSAFIKASHEPKEQLKQRWPQQNITARCLSPAWLDRKHCCWPIPPERSYAHRSELETLAAGLAVDNSIQFLEAAAIARKW